MKRRKNIPSTLEEKKELEKHKTERLGMILVFVLSFGFLILLFFMEYLRTKF